MTEYTKGPWAWKVGVDDNQNKEWRLSPGILITSYTDGTPWGDSIDKANARIISAAPDMLEALEALVVAVEREAKIEGVSGIACEKLPFARSAIAKAKGQ